MPRGRSLSQRLKHIIDLLEHLHKCTSAQEHSWKCISKHHKHHKRCSPAPAMEDSVLERELLSLKVLRISTSPYTPRLSLRKDSLGEKREVLILNRKSSPKHNSQTCSYEGAYMLNKKPRTYLNSVETQWKWPKISQDELQGNVSIYVSKKQEQTVTFHLPSSVNLWCFSTTTGIEV
jgi:hypothetical protein